MDGTAWAPGAGTILNALATGHGAAFAIEAGVEATVSLDPDNDTIAGTVIDYPETDTALIERAVGLTLDAVDRDVGGSVETRTDVPIAAGLKSSSAAANATVLATLDAVGESMDALTAAKIGVTAARDVGVTVTGAFDDATASMLGGVTITDNETDELLSHAAYDTAVLVWTPPTQAHSKNADETRCQQVAPVADLVEELAFERRYGTAMTVNGFAFSAALNYDPTPILEALPHAAGATISGTGPSVIAVGDPSNLATVRDSWEQREGTTWLTSTQTDGATTT